MDLCPNPTESGSLNSAQCS